MKPERSTNGTVDGKRNETRTVDKQNGLRKAERKPNERHKKKKEKRKREGEQQEVSSRVKSSCTEQQAISAGAAVRGPLSYVLLYTCQVGTVANRLD